jgi:hypothetical protein
MKKLFLLQLLFTSIVFAQDEFTSDYNYLIGKKYATENDISALKTFKYDQGVVIGNPNENPLFYTLDVFRNESTAVVLLSKKINLNPDEYKIINVLKINSIPNGNEIRTFDCTRKNGHPDENIIAVVDSGTKMKVKKTTMAYILNDIYFEKIASKEIECLNQGVE